MALPLRIEPVEYRSTWGAGERPVRLQLIVGEVSERSGRLHSSVYLRRRLVAGTIMILVLLAATYLVRFIGSSGEVVLPAVPTADQLVATSMPADAPGTLRGQVLVPGGVYVAQAGDTMWVIARSLKPSGEVTGTVRALIKLNGGPSLEVGQRVVLPA